MKQRMKKITVCLLLFTMVLQLTACSIFESKNKKYAAYVTSLLDANYKGTFETFLEMTESDQEAVETAYNEGIEHLTNSLIAYYGIELVDDGSLREEFVALTKKIYAATKYEVKPAVKSGDSYTVEVLIYPIDILQSTYDDVIAYIESFNKKKEAGDFDEYEIEQYETEFAKGILDILDKAADNMGYLDYTSTIVSILTEGDTYYISDEDFTKLDNQLIAQVEDTSETTEEVTEEASTEKAPGINDTE